MAMERASVRGSLPYVASAANDAAVRELVASGFTPEQARQIVANAKKSPEQVAQDAARAGAGYVVSAANEQAKASLVGAGFTPVEAEKLVASGTDVSKMLSTLEAVGVARLNEVVVAQLVSAGLRPEVAEVLAATGGDPKKLLAIAKDPEKVTALLSDIDARLRKEGIDLGARLKSGIGLSDKDAQTLGTVTRAASAAYDLFQGVDALMGAQAARGYVAARWDESLVKSDPTFAELTRTIQGMAGQSETRRAELTAQYKAGARKIAGSVATLAAFIPVAGPVIAFAVGVVQVGLEMAGIYDAKSDDNSQVHKDRAMAAPKALWQRWYVVPPTFDSTYYTLRSYGETVEQMRAWLEESNAEVPWRDGFYDVLFQSVNQVLGETSPLVDDLTVLGWFPFSFTDWAGGANLPNTGGSWNIGSSCSVEGTRFDPVLRVGAEGWVEPAGGDCGRTFRFNAKAATNDAREEISSVPTLVLPVDRGEGAPVPGGVGRLPHGETVAAEEISGFDRAPFTTYAWRSDGGGSYVAERTHVTMVPRNEKLQMLICDRIAATLATLMAVVYGKPVEPLVEAGVGASRRAVEVHTWAPERAAWRLRDTFLAIASAAASIASLEGASKYAAIPVMVDTVSPALRDPSIFDLSDGARASIAERDAGERLVRLNLSGVRF